MKRYLEELLEEHDVLKSLLNEKYNRLMLCADFEEEQIQHDIDSLERQLDSVTNRIDCLMIASLEM